MAKLELELNDDLEKQLAILSRSDEIIEDILTAASKPLERALKQECGKHSRTGQLANSIKAGNVKKFKNGGSFIEVAPTGNRKEYQGKNGKQYKYKNGKQYKYKKATTNYELLAHLEYGTAKQPKTPLIENAVKQSERQCNEIMQQKFNEYMQKGGSA